MEDETFKVGNVKYNIESEANGMSAVSKNMKFTFFDQNFDHEN